MPRQSKTAAFSRRYRDGLRSYCDDASDSPPRSPAFRLLRQQLGRDACALAVTPLALARIHEDALAAMPKQDSVRAREREAEKFFDHVLAPIEAMHRPASDDGRRARLLRTALRERTATLVETRTHLHAERERTKSLAAEVAASGRERDDLRDTATLTTERLGQVTRQLLTAQEDERLRISRDLHDDLGQNLTAVNFTLAALRDAAAADAKELQGDIRRSQQILMKTMKRVRTFASELRPPLLDHLGLVAALRTLTQARPRGRRLEVRFSTDTEELALDIEQATAMYRVAQEALTNVRRHARATRVDVILRTQPTAVQMEVRDNGRAFDPNKARSNPKRGLGMHCMQERMTLIGGTLDIHSSKGHGTRVIADLPYAGVESE